MASFRVLGPVEAVADGEPVALGGRRQVTLLAFLLLHANEAVSSDALTEAVWGSASGTDNRLPMAITRLRKALQALGESAGPRLRTVGGGYLLSSPTGSTPIASRSTSRLGDRRWMPAIPRVRVKNSTRRLSCGVGRRWPRSHSRTSPSRRCAVWKSFALWRLRRGSTLG